MIAGAADAERNARLLCELKEARKADAFGNIARFFEVEPDWRCPACCRSKQEIARGDKNGNLLCAIVQHHDHFGDFAEEMLDLRRLEDWTVARAIRESLVRFAPTLVCDDCNVADPRAKLIVEERRPFSFAPYEIASFIRAKPNAPHDLDHDRVRAAHDAAQPAMALLGMRLREALAVRRNAGGDAWEHISAPAARVLANARLRAQKPSA